MKACIVGCGAVGCLLAYFLYRATGEPVEAVVRRRNHALLLMEEGALVRGVPQGRVRVNPYLPGEAPRDSCDAAFIATKAYDAASAFREARRISRGWVVASVNGFPRLPRDPLLAWLVVEYGVTRLEDSLFSFNGGGGMVLGPEMPHPDLKSLRRLATLLEAGGAEVRVVGNVAPYRWGKAAVNAGINPVTALLGVENGFILSDGYAWRTASRAALEVAETAARLGIRLPYEPVEHLRVVAMATGRNRSSMLQDLLSCRKTEADEILGEVISIGRRVGASVGTLETLYFLVKSLEAYREKGCVKGRR